MAEKDAAAEFLDWELLHGNSDSESDMVKSSLLVGDVGVFEAIRSDHFSLPSSKTDDLDTEGSDRGSVESDNPSWIDPGSESRYAMKNTGELWSDSRIDLTENELGIVEKATTQLGFEGSVNLEATNETCLIFDDYESKPEASFCENIKNGVGLEGFGGIPFKDNDFGNLLWSDSSVNGSVSMDAKESVEESVISGESVGEDGFMSASASVGSIEEMNGNLKSDAEVEKNRSMWWKVPFEMLKYCVLRVSPVWTFSMAAAVMGFVILGRRLYKMKLKSRSLKMKVTMDDKKVSQFMSRAARLNEAFSIVRRSPIVRPALPAAGMNSWPVMSMR